jgi:hypothetical protein
MVIGVLVPVCAADAARGAHAALPSCRTSQFTVRFGPPVSEATGQHTNGSAKRLGRCFDRNFLPARALM